MSDTPRPFKKPQAGRVEVHFFPKKKPRLRGASGEVEIASRTYTLPDAMQRSGEKPPRSYTPTAEHMVAEEQEPKKRKTPKSTRRASARTASVETQTQSDTLPEEAPAPSVVTILTSRSPLAMLRGLSRRQVNDVALEGHGLFESGDLGTARKLFEYLVAMEPDESFSYTMLGTILLALGRQDRALALFEAALAIDKADVAARVYRGEIRLHLGRYKHAIDDLERAVADGDGGDPFVDRAMRLMKIARQAHLTQQLSRGRRSQR